MTIIPNSPNGIEYFLNCWMPEELILERVYDTTKFKCFGKLDRVRILFPHYIVTEAEQMDWYIIHGTPLGDRHFKLFCMEHDCALFYFEPCWATKTVAPFKFQHLMSGPEFSDNRGVAFRLHERYT